MFAHQHQDARRPFSIAIDGHLRHGIDLRDLIVVRVCACDRQTHSMSGLEKTCRRIQIENKLTGFIRQGFSVRSETAMIGQTHTIVIRLMETSTRSPQTTVGNICGTTIWFDLFQTGKEVNVIGRAFNPQMKNRMSGNFNVIS
jgi:hypothetical protein